MENPGITFGYKQKLPSALLHLDGGRRAKVGDCVSQSWRYCYRLRRPHRGPLFPGKLKEKMTVISLLLKDTFKSLNITLNPRPTPKNLDTINFENNLFCSTYINPFEWYYKNEKIIAITCRSYKTVILVQCICHLYDNNKTFQDLSEFSSVFSGGLPQSIRPQFSELYTVLNKQILDL